MGSDRAKKPYGRKYEQAVIKEARRQGFKGYSIAILTAILSFRNYDTGQARPGNQKIREMTGAGRNTLDRHLKELRGAGILVQIAYPNGGFKCATVYGFGLPAWSGYERQNHPQNGQIPPPKKETTTPKSGAPTERTERTGDAARASRPQGDKVLADMSESELARMAMRCVWKPVGTTYAAARAEGARICAEMAQGADVVAIWGEPVPVDRCDNAHLAAE